MPGVRLHRQGNIVEHAEIEKQRGDLERARKAECAALISRQGGDVGTGKANAAGVRRQFAANLGDQRGLTGAVRTNHGMQLAAGDLEREIVARHDALEAFGQIIYLQQRLVHARTLASKPSMPPRANSTTSNSNGPRMICQYSVMLESAPSSTSSATAPISGP